MNAPAPHFLLSSDCGGPQLDGRWRFVLESADGSHRIEAEDEEPDVRGERLELLTIVRGLEAVDQPARVTLVNPSRYVSRGVVYGLEDWRSADWTWEFHGHMVPIKNRDLWQRIDRAMQIHDIDCRLWRVDPSHAPLASPALDPFTLGVDADEDEPLDRLPVSPAPGRQGLRRIRIAVLRHARRWAERWEKFQLRFKQLGLGWWPHPWMD